MKKMILSLFVLFFTTAVVADILTPRERSYRKQQQLNLYKCNKDKPLLDVDGNCYPCDTVKNIQLNKDASFLKCSELCPNRYNQRDRQRKDKECIPRCILKNPPDDSYAYVECEGWVKK